MDPILQRRYSNVLNFEALVAKAAAGPECAVPLIKNKDKRSTPANSGFGKQALGIYTRHCMYISQFAPPGFMRLFKSTYFDFQWVSRHLIKAHYFQGLFYFILTPTAFRFIVLSFGERQQYGKTDLVI